MRKIRLAEKTLFKAKGNHVCRPERIAGAKEMGSTLHTEFMTSARVLAGKERWTTQYTSILLGSL